MFHFNFTIQYIPSNSFTGAGRQFLCILFLSNKFDLRKSTTKENNNTILHWESIISSIIFLLKTKKKKENASQLQIIQISE